MCRDRQCYEDELANEVRAIVPVHPSGIYLYLCLAPFTPPYPPHLNRTQRLYAVCDIVSCLILKKDAVISDNLAEPTLPSMFIKSVSNTLVMS